VHSHRQPRHSGETIGDALANYLRLESVLRKGLVTSNWSLGFSVRQDLDPLKLNTAHIDKLAILAALGDHESVEELLCSIDDSNAISLFGNSLTNAATLGHAKVVRVIVDHLKMTRGDGETNYTVLGAVDREYLPLDAIKSGIDGGNADIVSMLVDYHETTPGPRVRKFVHNGLLERAIRSGKADMVQSVLSMNFKHPTRVTREMFQYACGLGHAEVAVSLLGDGLISKDKAWEHTTPLIVAVESRSFHVTEAVLNAGVEKNVSIRRGKQFMTALQIALGRKKKPMVQLLLDNGVQLPPLCDWPHKEDFYIMLRNETLKRGAKDCPDVKTFRKMKLPRSRKSS